ncbi:MAG: hypothetical protein ACYC9O_01965 [Candidatus Latescibacterota bacterium]
MSKRFAAVLALFAAATFITAQTPPPNTPAQSPPAGQEQQTPPAPQPQQGQTPPAPAQKQEQTPPAAPAPTGPQSAQPQAGQQTNQPVPQTQPGQPSAQPQQPQTVPQAPPQAQPAQLAAPSGNAPAAAKPDSVPLPPLPPMRNIITTEKPIKGSPAGVTPGKQIGTAAGEAANAPAPEGQPPAVSATQTAAMSAAAKGKLGAAGADSGAVAILPPQGRQPQAPPRSAQPQKKKTSEVFREELSLFNAPTAGLRTSKMILDDDYNLMGMVYGEQLGFIRILEADNSGNFSESWKSPPLNSEVRGIFVENLDRIGEAEIVAYTLDGNIFIYGYDSRELKYKSPEGTYQGINCMLVANLDTSPELELLFITKAGKMIQFDSVTRFEEWTSTDTYEATDMVYGNVDNDRNMELILNTGEILNFQFKSVKWKMDAAHIRPNSRLYLIDMDNDNILELVVEYDQQYVRFFDIDQRREKW